MNYTYIDVDFNNNYDAIGTYLQRALKKFGMSLNNFSGITFSIEYLKKLLSVCPDDLIFIKLSNDHDKNIKLKNLICECFNSFLVKNTACSFAIESYLRLFNGIIDNPQNFENESLIPDGAEPITSDLGFVQGFMVNFKSINICFIPPEIEQVKDIVTNKLPSILSRLYKTPTEFMYLKVFGVNEETLTKILLPFINNSMGVLINFTCNQLDGLVSIGYTKNTNENELDSFVAQVCESLKKYLYATEDTTLQEMVLDYIKLTNKKVSLFESITRGKLFCALADKNPKITHSNIVEHKVVIEPSDLFYLDTLDKNQLSQKGLYTVESVYEVATAIISENNSDLTVLSIADCDDAKQTVTCFLAIGDSDGVHIYKNTYKGKSDDIQEIIINNTCFYIIKKLKQNNLLFDQKL